MLNHAYLREILHYSIITGRFYYLKSTARCVKVGDTAGTLHADGYRLISIKNKIYSAHRLAWFYCTGEWPQNEIDHKNGVRDANYWLNIRDADRFENSFNRAVRKDSSTGFKGVERAGNRFQARIRANGERYGLGSYATPELAYAARIKAEKELHKDFARQ